MPTPILMPALSPTMTEGTLANWLKAEGDTIESGDVIAEIETDKATMEVEAVDEGVLGKILIAAGTQNVAVNAEIGVLLADGESMEDYKPAASSPAEKVEKEDSSSAPVRQDEEVAVAATPSPAPVSKPQSKPNNSGRIFASPLAKRLAKDASIDLSTVTGTGPKGRIIKVDIENYQPPKATAQQASNDLSFDAKGMPPARIEQPSTMRQVIARRLTESKQTVPHFYLTVEVALDALMALRKQINERENNPVKLTVNDFIIRASALALKEVPAANASWQDDGVHYYERADISVAVAINGGLITPILRGADQKRLPELSTEMKDLGGRAKAGKLLPEEFTGGTFSISNLGMFGISNFQAIVNPPQGAILAIGAGSQKVVIKDGQMVSATIMNCTLSVDHRVVDGAVGAEFMAAFKRLMEDPIGLVL